MFVSLRCKKSVFSYYKVQKILRMRNESMIKGKLKRQEFGDLYVHVKLSLPGRNHGKRLFVACFCFVCFLSILTPSL